ncbi:MAG: alpha/beta fold hydrolase [Aeromicrobium sp.]|nr:alpha/beta fold hydrolase [Burkholderiales bacterium]
MIQALLRLALGTELAVYVLLLWWMNGRGSSALVMVTTVVLIASLWRASHATGSFVVASFLRWREGISQPSGSAWRAWVSEFSARLISFNWSQPFADYVMGADPLVVGTGTPILLVHGYCSNRGMWVKFRQRLQQASVGPVFSVDLSPPFASIDRLATQLATRIEEVCKLTGASQVFVIAHSMGGLVTRAYMQQDRQQMRQLSMQQNTQLSGTQRIAGFMSLGSPHHGSALATFGLGVCVREIRRQSDWLARLAQSETQMAHTTLPAWSIYTTNDDLAYPPETSRLSWADNIVVDGVGHVGLLYSAHVFAIVKNILDQHVRARDSA